MQKIPGIQLAHTLISDLSLLPVPKKFLAIFVVGDRKETDTFIHQKKKVAQTLGVDFRVYRYDTSITQDKLRSEIHRIGDHSSCGGIVLQLPLPSHINAAYCVNAIPVKKDVDVLSGASLGLLTTNRQHILPPAVCAVDTILRFVAKRREDVSHAVIVGYGSLVGRPVSLWFCEKVSTCTVLEKGGDMSVLLSADVIVSGTGDAGFLHGSLVKKDAILIDFGYGIDSKGVCRGDIDVASLEKEGFLGWYTPTPGGTGPLVVAALFSNFYRCNE